MKLADKIKKYFKRRKRARILDEQEKINPALKAARDKARHGIPVNREELALILENEPE